MKIRLVEEKDFPAICKIFQSVISKGDSYVNYENSSEEEIYEKWMDKKAKTFVIENEEKILGAYLINSNQIDRGSHIANASYIVDENTRGLGVGKALALHSIKIAEELNYKGIQFNFVISTNSAAVKLWQSVGFKIIGTSPKAFNHKELGYVDTYIMFREI